jgi:hypothetical protein
MVCHVLADALLEKLGGDSISEMMPRFDALRRMRLSDLPMDNAPWRFNYEEPMTITPAPTTLTPDQFNATAARIEAEVSKIIIGQADVIRTLFWRSSPTGTSCSRDSPAWARHLWCAHLRTPSTCASRASNSHLT